MHKYFVLKSQPTSTKLHMTLFTTNKMLLQHYTKYLFIIDLSCDLFLADNKPKTERVNAFSRNPEQETWGNAMVNNNIMPNVANTTPLPEDPPYGIICLR